MASEKIQYERVARDSRNAYSRSGPFRAFVLIALLVTGGVLWLHSFGQEFVYGVQYYGLLACLALAGLALAWPRPFAAALRWFWRRRHFSPRTRGFVAVGCVLAGGLLPLGVGLSQDISFQPAVCDEYSYLAQAQLLAHGRLWSRGHDLPDFFGNFQVIAAPVYASIYFPGTALWVTPWVLVAGGPSLAWCGSLLALALATGLAYLVAAELADDWAALLVVAVMAGSPVLRSQGLMVMGQAPVTMFALLLVLAYLRWRRAAGREGGVRRMLLWAVVAGLAAGWGMLTRPVDLLAYALPVIAFVLLARVPPRRRVASVAAALVGVAPFAAMQLPFNKAVTGSYLRTPFSWYADKYIPGTGYELGERSLDRVPPQAMPNYQLSYKTFSLPFVREANLPIGERAYVRAKRLFISGLPHGLMLLVMPCAVPLLLRRPRLWLLAAPLPLALGMYLPYGFFLNQYAAAVVPAMGAWVILGACELAAAAVPGLRRRTTATPLRRRPGRLAPAVALVFVGGALMLCTRGIPGLATVSTERWYQVPELRKIDADLAAVPGRAVVFLSPPSMNDPLEAEATYNLDVVFPDDARVVRAHDLGGRNVELVEYYARLQPDREAYRFDRDADVLTRLGNVADLAARPAGELRQRFEADSAWWRRAYREALDTYDASPHDELP